MITVKEIDTLHHSVRCEYHVGEMVMRYRRDKTDVKCYSVASILVTNVREVRMCRRHAAFYLLDLYLGKTKT